MAERVVLHVGLMKSGTSFIQQVLRQNDRLLRERGVLFPTPWNRQVKAVKDVIQHGSRGQEPLADDGPWRRLVGAAHEWPGTVVISMEFLAPRKLPTARRIIADFAPAEVEVVVSVRDLARTIPAMWQESVQNWGLTPWEDYVAGVRAEDRSRPGPGRAFWGRQDASAITEVWQKAAGRDRVTVLTVPPRGADPGLLWERFAALVPVASDGLDLDVRSNPSLGLASLLVLQRLNVRLRETSPPVTPKQYERTVKQLLAKRGMAGRDEPRLGHDADWVAVRGAEEVERLRRLRPRIAGDLGELACAPVAGVQPTAVTTEEQLDAAVDALAEVTARLARKRNPDGAAPAGKGTRRQRKRS